MELTNHGQALNLKYRPQSLDEIVGNEDIIGVLRGQLKNKNVPKSLCFHGPTGCGKTTLGRIMAHELGARGNDIMEIDSADFRGIDTIRDIRRRSTYQPLEGPYRVFILDEAHRLTGDGQSALLKALEDTPTHVFYFLCTTDPQKLLPTILGRCSQFQVRTLVESEMITLLRRVVKAEEETLSRSVYHQIVKDSLGHPRNALQILAQVLAVPEEDRMKVATKAAERQSTTIELCRALTGAAPWMKIAGILKGLKEEDPEQIRRAVLGYCQQILLTSAQQNDGIAAVMQEFLEPFYNSGFPGLVFACYSAIFSEAPK